MRTYKQLLEKQNEMRTDPEPSEAYLHDRLVHLCRKDRLTLVFQQIIAPYIVDFLIVEKMLVIEVDGTVHLKRDVIKKDRARDLYLTRLGFTIVRIPAWDVVNMSKKRLQKLTDGKRVRRDDVWKVIREAKLSKYGYSHENEIEQTVTPQWTPRLIKAQAPKVERIIDPECNLHGFFSPNLLHDNGNTWQEIDSK